MTAKQNFERPPANGPRLHRSDPTDGASGIAFTAEAAAEGAQSVPGGTPGMPASDPVDEPSHERITVPAYESPALMS